MILLEIALQGIRGFQPLTRIPLRPGMNVARTPDAQQRRALVDSIYHLIYPDPGRTGATTKLAEPGAKESRIALTFFGRDQVTYRIVREAASGAVSLHKFDADSKKYNALTRSSQEVAQFIRVQQQIPDEVGYERLFVFAPETMPSLGTRAKTRSGQPIATGLVEQMVPSGPGIPGIPRAASVVQQRAVSRPRGQSSISGPPSVLNSMTPLPGGFGSALNMTNALVQSELSGDINAPAADQDEADRADLEEKRAQLEKLRGERETAARAEKAQVELDALNARKFEISDKVERVKELKAEVERIKQNADPTLVLENLPKGFGERLRHMEEMQTKYQSDRTKLNDERGEVEQALAHQVVVGLGQDRYFIAGIALAGLFVALAVLLAKPALALLNILALTVAAGAAFRFVGDLEKQARTKLKLTAIIEREQRLDKQFELDTAAIKRLMQNLQVTEPHELLERIEGAQQLEKQLRVAEEALDRQLMDPAVVDADREMSHILARIERCEAEVMGATQGVSSGSLDRRIVALEREVSDLERADAASILEQLRQGQPIRDPSGRRDPFKEGTPVSSSLTAIPSQPTAARQPLTRTPSNVTASIPRAPTGVRAPTSEAASLFDFGGGTIGGGDEEEDAGGGYGSGYGQPGGGGGGRGPGQGGGRASSHDGEDRGLSEPLLAIGSGGFPPGGGSGIGGYDDGSDASAWAADRSRDLMQAALDLLAIPVDDLAGKLAPRIGQYLLAFTDGIYASASFGARGEMLVMAQGAAEPVPFMALPLDHVDLVDAALRFSLIESCVARFKIPVLFDDPFAAFPQKKRMLLSQMLGYIASATQLVLLTEKQDVNGNMLPL